MDVLPVLSFVVMLLAMWATARYMDVAGGPELLGLFAVEDEEDSDA